MALTLYTWPPCTSGGWKAAALPSVCVECLAVEAYLHLLGVAFTVKHCTSPEQSPTGALPACVFDDEQAPGFVRSVESKARSAARGLNALMGNAVLKPQVRPR